MCWEGGRSHTRGVSAMLALPPSPTPLPPRAPLPRSPAVGHCVSDRPHRPQVEVHCHLAPGQLVPLVVFMGHGGLEVWGGVVPVGAQLPVA